MRLAQFIKTLSRSQKVAASIAVFLLLYAFAGFIIVPIVLKNTLDTVSESFLNNRIIEVESLNFNPFALSVSASNLHVKGLNNESFAGLDYLYINFQLSSLFRGVWTFSEIAIIKPYKSTVVDMQGQFNFADLLVQEEQVAPAKDEHTEEAEIPAILVFNLHIDSAVWVFTDQSKAKSYEAEVGPVTIKLTDFTTRRKENSPYRLKAESDNGIIGREFIWEGDISINPLISKGHLSIKGLNLEKIAGYFERDYAFDLHNGLVDIAAHYDFDYSNDAMLFSLSDAAINLSDFLLSQGVNNSRDIMIGSANVEGLNYVFQEQHLTIKKVELKDSSFVLEKGEDSRFNVQKFTDSHAVQGNEKVAEETVNQPQQQEQQNLKENSVTDEKSKFYFQLDTFQVLNNSLVYIDRTFEEDLKLSLASIDVVIANINFLDDNVASFDANFAFEPQGNQLEDNFSVKGEVVLLPNLSVTADYNVNQLVLPALQPYVQEFASVKINQGMLSSQGVVVYKAVDESLLYKGSAVIDQLDVKSLSNNKNLLDLHQLQIKGVDYNSKTPALKLEQLILDKPKLLVVFDENAKLNLSKISKKDDQAKPLESSPGESLLSIELNELLIKALDIEYEDYSINPYFAIAINDFSGSIKGLSSKANTLATMDLHGTVDRYAPINFSGDLNFLTEDVNAEIQLDMQNINMTSFTPYSRAYIAREIDKGKLDIDVKYHIEDNQLVADNYIFIDQLTLGKKVKSDKATNLPVALGISLLKNQKGEIAINMPVKGDLNDPDFRYGKLVFKALGNILVKAAASPFKMLAGAIGSEEDLGLVYFAAGSDRIDDEMATRLMQLETALQKRPELKIEVTGCYNVAIDAPALKLANLTVRLNPKSKKYSEAGYRKLLEKAYEKQFQQTVVYPDTLLEDAEKITQLESVLSKEEVLTEQQLQALAQKRQKEIQHYLLKSEKIIPHRLYLTGIEPVKGDAIVCQLRPY